jgi:prepilin-type N-terminal cleavage/methylation domain-containing protein
MHKPNRTAFTLIELLVVIAIIGILISILTPVLLRMKDEARKVQCIANMKAWGAMVGFYATNPKTYGQLPPIAGGNKMFYDQTQGMIDQFAEYGLKPQCAYSPSSPAFGSAYASNEWFCKRWSAMVPDWANAVTVDNQGDGTLTGPAPVNTVLGPVDDQGGADKFAASGWSSQADGDATDGQVSYHDGGSSPAEWTFEASEIPAGSATSMALTAHVYKSTDGHPSVKYTVTGPSGEMGSQTIDHYAATPSWSEVALGSYAIASGADYTVTVEGQGPGGGGGTTIDWSGGLITDDNDTPSPLTLQVPATTGGSGDLATTWGKLNYAFPTCYDDQAYATDAAGAKFTYTVLTPITKNTSGTVTLWAYINKTTSDRATQVSYSLVTSDGSATATPASRTHSHSGSAKAWYEIGTFAIPAQPATKTWTIVVEKTAETSNSGAARVWLDAVKLVGTLTPTPGGSWVWADSVKLEGPWVAPTPEPTDGYHVLEGAFILSTTSADHFRGAGWASADKYYQVALAGSAEAKKAGWYFTPKVSGKHGVYAMWPGTADCATDAKFVIYSADTPSGKVCQMDQTDTINNNGTFTDATKADAPWRDLSPTERLQFNVGEVGHVELHVPAGATAHHLADGICIAPDVQEDYERNLIGYLYLGHRSPVPGSASGGANLANEMPRSVKGCSNPSGTALLVDMYAEENREWTSHKDGIHVMHVDGSVIWKDASELQPRWTDLFGTTFSW